MTKRKVEIFSAGCPACDDVIELVNKISCSNCEVSVLDMNQKDIADRARSLGIKSVPAVAVDGKLADCCSGRGPNEEKLKAAGIGRS